MGTSLGHQKYFVSIALEGRSHPDFTLTAVVFPAVIKEVDTSIDRSVNNIEGGFLVCGLAQMVATEAERRDLHPSLSEGAHRNFATGFAGSLKSQSHLRSVNCEW